MYDKDVNSIRPALAIHVKTLQELYAKPFVRALYLYEPKIDRSGDLEIVSQEFYGIRIVVHACQRMLAELQFHKSGGVTHYTFNIDQVLGNLYGKPTRFVTNVTTTSNAVVLSVLAELGAFVNLMPVLPKHAKFVLVLGSTDDYSASINCQSRRLDQGQLDFLTKYNPHRNAVVGTWSKLDSERIAWVEGLTEDESLSVGCVNAAWYRYLTSLWEGDTVNTLAAKRLAALKMEAKPCMPNLA